MLLGFYSSAAVRADGGAGRAAQEVHVDHHLHLLARCSRTATSNTSSGRSPSASSSACMSTDFVAQNAEGQARQGPQGPAGRDHPRGRRLRRRRRQGQRGRRQEGTASTSCSKEGYSATAPDLSALVTKLKRARPDVIFHTGYNPDITLFLRQAREQGLRFSALIGHGAGYGVYRQAEGDVRQGRQLLLQRRPDLDLARPTRRRSSPSCCRLIKMVGDEYDKARAGHRDPLGARRDGAPATPTCS